MIPVGGRMTSVEARPIGRAKNLLLLVAITVLATVSSTAMPGVSIQLPLPAVGSQQPGGAATLGVSTKAQPTAGGGLSLTNSRDGTFVVTASNIKPGAQASGSVLITNTGAPSTVTLSETGITSGGRGTGNLAADLLLTVTDTTASTVLFSGALNGLPGTTLCGVTRHGQCASWAKGEAHTVAFSVRFPNSSNNSYQATSASATFVWTATK